MSKKAVILRVVLEYADPSKRDMLHLSNGIFTAKNVLKSNSLSIGHINEPPIFHSNNWLHNLQAVYELSMNTWSDKTYQTILQKNKKGY